MATTAPVRTTAAKMLLEAVDHRISDLDQDEAHTADRYALRAWREVRHLLGQCLPDVEADAVTRAMPGTSLAEASFLLGDPDVPSESPDDPTIPFAWEAVERSAEQEAVSTALAWSL